MPDASSYMKQKEDMAGYAVVSDSEVEERRGTSSRMVSEESGIMGINQGPGTQ